jgi:hypothetical protein
MPDPNNNTKMTGDTHLPDTESEFNVEEANPQGAGREGSAGRGGKKAGVLKDQEAQTSDSYGNPRASGEQ